MSSRSLSQFRERLRTAATAVARTDLLHDLVAVVDPLLDGGPESETLLWNNFQGSGLLDLMLDQLSQPWNSYSEDIGLIGQYFRVALVILQKFFGMCPPGSFGDTPRRMPVVCRVALDTLERLGAVPGHDVLSLQYRVSVLLGESYIIYGRDSAFFDTLDKYAILRLIFAVLFEADSHQQIPIECGLIILSDASRMEGQSYRIVWRQAERRYGHTKVAQRCADMWAITGVDEGYLTGLMNLMMIIKDTGSQSVVLRTLHECGVYEAIPGRFWRTRRLRISQHSDSMSAAELRTDVEEMIYCLTRLLDEINKDLRWQWNLLIEIIKGLLEHEDVILFVGHGLLEFSGINREPQIESLCRMWIYWIMLTCRQHPDLFDSCCRPALAQVNDSMESICRCVDILPDQIDYRVAARHWRKLYMDVDSLLARSPTGVSPQRGCGWIRCLAYPPANVGRVTGLLAAMLRCSGCHQVQYCGAPCQKRDWVAGHKAQCQSPTPVIS